MSLQQKIKTIINSTIVVGNKGTGEKFAAEGIEKLFIKELEEKDKEIFSLNEKLKLFQNEKDKHS